MLLVKDNRPDSITVEDEGEVVLRYNWLENPSLDRAAEVVQQRLVEMGQDDIAGVLADQVKKL